MDPKDPQAGRTQIFGSPLQGMNPRMPEKYTKEGKLGGFGGLESRMENHQGPGFSQKDLDLPNTSQEFADREMSFSSQTSAVFPPFLLTSCFFFFCSG